VAEGVAAAPTATATPTPEIETVALWATAPETGSPSVSSVVTGPEPGAVYEEPTGYEDAIGYEEPAESTRHAEPEEPTGYEETMAILPEAAFSDETSAREDLVMAAEAVAEPEPERT
jgi:hypothetical protein